MTSPLPDEHALDDRSLEPERLADLQAAAQGDGRECVVSAIIVDAQGRAFVQRRSLDRKLLPGCWDIAGGHVEPGETLYSALEREIAEETGWRLTHLLRLLAVTDWEAETMGRMRRKREFSFLVTVEGDLTTPRVEREKVSEFRWIGIADLDVLREHRMPADLMILELVKAGLDAASERMR